jgi:hypothetical protein
MFVKDAMKYALAAEKKIYTLEDREAELAKPAGQRVTLKGILGATRFPFRKSLHRNKNQIRLYPGIRSSV